MKTGLIGNRRQFLRSAAAAGALSVSSLARPAWAAADIKIGFVLPLTGPFAEAGQLQKAAVDMAIEEINAQGGVKCLGGAKLVAVYGSYQTDVAEANVETERLLSNEKVVGIIGPYGSGVAIAGTEIAERAKVPYLVPNALSDEITARHLKYTFKTVPHVSQFATDSAKLVRELDKKAGVEAKTASLVRADDYFGNVVGEQFRANLPKFDFEILSDNTYPNNATSMEDVILKLKSDDPDVVFASGEPAAITLLFQQLKELDYWPKLGWVGAGGGYSNPITHKNLGDLGEGLLVVSDWFPDIKRPGAKEANDRFKAKTGVDMLGNANTTYAGVWIFYLAIEKACSEDPTKIRDALASLDLSEGVPMFMYPHVAFDENGFMKFASNVAAQIKNGEARVVWPADLAVTEAKWPVPGWDKRG
ncbi:MAG: ABC transporter substrate-binding protein [Parvibaculaceae bacterium]